MANDESRALAIDIIARFDKLERAMNKAQGIVKSGSTAMTKSTRNFSDNVEKSFGRSNQVVTQLSQRFDHLSSALSGTQSPMQIAIQQSAHFSEILAGMSAGEALGAVGGAFTSLLNPISLATIAIIGASTYALKYFSSWVSGSKDATVSAAAQEKALSDLSEHWGDSLTALRAYYDAQKKAQHDAASSAGYASVIKGDTEAQAKALASLHGATLPISSLIGFGTSTPDIQKFQDALRQLTNAGSDTAQILEALNSLQQAMASIAKDTAAPALRTYADSFGKLISSATDATEALRDVNNQIAGAKLSDAFADLQRTIAEIDPSGANTRLESIKKQVADLGTELGTGQITIDEFKAAILSIGEANPDVSSILDAIGKIGDAAADARKQIAGLVNEGSKEGRLKTLDQAQTEYNNAYNMARRFGELSDLDTPSKPKVAASGGSHRPHLNAYQRASQSTSDRTATIEAETEAMSKINPLIEDYGETLAEARKEQELTNAAQKAGIPITDSLASSIHDQAVKYGDAVAAQNKLQESQDKLRQSMADFQNTSKDVLGGFITDLEDGKSAATALGDALKKVGDKLLDAGLNDLFGTGAKPGTAILGGLFRLGRMPANDNQISIRRAA